MRLKVTVNITNKLIPYEYHGFLQGMIYHALLEDQGKFFHDEGFELKNRVYKMFVFSELSGKYEASREGLKFLEPATFYVSSISSDFLNQLYLYFKETPYVRFGGQYAEVVEVLPVKDIEYDAKNIYVLQTLSPILAYKTDEKSYTTYFHPRSQDFENSLRDNLNRKYSILYNNSDDEFFEILNIERCKEVKVKFKKNVFVAYVCSMKVRVSDKYLKLLMHTGLGSKNAGGFGMVRIKSR